MRTIAVMMAGLSYLVLFSAQAIAAPPAAADADRAGLVASWNFDDSQGRLAADSSGHGNHLLVVSGRLVKGVRNTAFELDGQTCWASCPDSPSLAPTTAITLEAWIQPWTLPEHGTSTVIRKSNSYALRFAGRRLALLLWIDGRRQSLDAAKTDWAGDRWYHLAATYDGRQMRLFIDGREDPARPRPQTGRIEQGPNSCGIGAYEGQGHFRGLIDDARIYRRALSAEEIRASYSAGLAAAVAQRSVAFAPRWIGSEFPQLRKPARKVTMVQDGFLWIDAEDFADYGGWRLDTQFVHLMGSGYLIAASVGVPVRDASTEIQVPQPGKFRLWVRAKNWLRSYSPGKFQVTVAGQCSPRVFGAADTEAWTWQPGGDFQLPQGPARVTLHDLTGYYGRCDAIVLTTDLGYVPPERLDDVQKERSRLTGLSLAPQLVGAYDVIVVGAGAAGNCAALAAARLGAKTALIQDRPVLGGNSSIELGVPINGAGSLHANARESGIIEEAGRIKARYGFPKMSEPFMMLAEGEKNLAVFLNRRVIAAEMAGPQRIAGVQAVDTLTGEVTAYRAKMFIDCTGDGWLGYYAGAKYRHGRESRDEFDESLAPERSDHINMSGCLMGELALSYRAENMGKPVAYVPPPWAAKLPPPGEFGRTITNIGGDWWLEREGTIDTLSEAEKSRDELIRISYGYWDYIKNRWPERQKAANYALAFVPITEGKRESRRLVGDYILNQNDVVAATMFPDRISYGGWPMDVHHPRGIYSGREGPFHSDLVVPIYGIPFRCLYSVNIANLLFAGRDVSVTHMALGTVRVQGTLSPLGQAAGTAAALCLKLGLAPRQLLLDQLDLLQQTLLKYDQYIPQLTNQDPLDLARKAHLTASSTAQFEQFGRPQIHSKPGYLLSTSRAVMFPVGARGHFQSVFVRLKSERAVPTPITLHLREAAGAGDFSATADVATAQALVPPQRETDVEFRVDCEVRKPYFWVWLPKTEGIAWALLDRAPAEACRAYGGVGEHRPWHVAAGQFHALYTSPPLVFPSDYRVENVTRGIGRIVGRTSNLWASEPKERLPQWIELAFDKPTRLNTVYLTFDTDMNAPFHDVAVVPQCVRDYRLSYDDGHGWKDLAAVEGNFQRRRVHRFAAVTALKLRLSVTATNGDPSARVFGIRAYDE
jgi:hypothetical protein